ncbi:MAG: DNA polymerase Y family protein, partial [Novosphingobium sp.]|nr:DNA polymerase Y family protein [Novosphingobium sp.]
MAIWLASLALDRWRRIENCGEGEGRDAAPLALVAETARGPRIETANAAAHAAGVQAGTLLADARGICPCLQ